MRHASMTRPPCRSATVPLHPVPATHRGRQGVRDYVAGAFADEQGVDEVRFGTPVVRGDRASVECWARLLDEHGAPSTLAGCAIARFDGDGLVAEVRDDWHVEAGHRPPPGDWGG
jgi:hypothetical protein